MQGEVMKKIGILILTLMVPSITLYGSDLVKAAGWYNDLDAVKQRIAAGESVDTRDQSGQTPLIAAAKYGNAQIVSFLLGEGAQVQLTDNSGNNALNGLAMSIFAQQNDTVVAIARLLIDRGIDINHQNSKRMTPLMAATFLGNEPLVRLLLERGAKVQLKNRDEDTALTLAKKAKRPDIVKLLDKDSSPNMRGAELMKAINKARPDLAYVKELIAGGADINAKDGEGFTPLMHAAGNGHKEIVELLLKRGAYAISTNRVGANALYEIVGYSPVEKAREDNFIAIVNLLIDNGIDINNQDKAGMTPLMRAASQGTEWAVKLLLERGANPFLSNWNNQTARELATQTVGFENIAETLDQAEIDWLVKKYS